MSFLPHLCLENIFLSLAQDSKTLHSCILVNKQWSVSSVPILWRDPFRLCKDLRKPNKLVPLLNTYLSFLPSTTQKLLDIKSIIGRPATFNYPVYLRSINVVLIHGSVEYWTESMFGADSTSLQKITPICQVLCEYFLCNSSRIDYLDLEYASWFDIFKLNGATTSLSSIKSVVIDDQRNFPEQFKNLSSVMQNTRYLRLSLIYRKNDPACKNIINLLQTQKYLKKISLFSHVSDFFQNIWDTLASSQLLHKSLTSIEFHEATFDNSALLQVSRFYNLRHLKLYRCRNFTGEIQEINNSLVFQNLSQLIICKIGVNPRILEFLLEKSNTSLNVLEFHDHVLNFYETILWCTSFCQNLSRFVASIQVNQIRDIILLFKECKKLEYFHIYDAKLLFEDEEEPLDEYSPPELESFRANELLEELGSCIPMTMRTIKVWMNWLIEIEDIEAFILKCVNFGLSMKVIEFRHCKGFGNAHKEVIRNYLLNNKSST
ncbi:27174_t:CDS:1 [Dentiscutata erythropus]|uniref:27174_t:CDS:1 n=1 Tax=Dentiscutata erythropus TaxID=1348616 RepID=A0A9N9IQP6_9GLOM|nr:27174_t:CDS:1 [Dentiscutata erythropus]